jgi:beta-lactamase superfamily II metal-dependent hydrolase
VEQNKVIWSVDQPTRGAVRYGFVSGEYDRIAYPLPADNADKVYSNGHEVPLLSAVVGVPIFIQRTDLTEAGQLFAAAEETVVFDAVPAEMALLTMTSIDVQFGDAHVIQLPSENKIVMIDAGNPYVSRRGQTAPQHVRRWLDDRAVSRIDVAMVSHMHADHYGGFVWGADAADNGILELYEVGFFLDVPEVSGNNDRHTDLLALLTTQNIPRYIITPGMTDQANPDILGWDPAVGVLVLNGGSQAEWANISHTGTRINNDSIVLKFSYGEVDIITGGDCEVEGESRILDHFAPQLDKVELFKAHHHGRYDANSWEFLTVIVPRISFIPVAFAAYYEGPDQGAEDTAQTLARLAAVGADVFRFDAAEPLARPNDNRTFWHTTFVTDGVSYEVHIVPSIWGI